MTTAFAFVLLLSTLIFVHELGHFLVAKACGVRVLKFSLGFGPAIGIGRHRLSWTRGHTEYVVAWFPLGGFVKMLGESLDEMGDPALIAHPEETLNGRPTWQKLAIVFAGPAMNLLLPVVVFMATLAVGMPRPLPVIGTIEPASPAEQAGLRPGDLITAAGGVPVEWWEDFDEVVRGRADAPLQVAYERDGEPAVASLEIVARSSFDPFGKVVSVGWAGADHPRLSAVLGVPDSSSPAALAGLHSGDRVEAVGGAPIETWQELANAYAAAQGGVELSLRRGADEEAPTLELTVPALGSVEALGVIPANVLVAGVDAEKPAGRAGLAAGDLILSVDGEPVGSFASFAETVRTSEGRPLRLAFARRGRCRARHQGAPLPGGHHGGPGQPARRRGNRARGQSRGGAAARRGDDGRRHPHLPAGARQDRDRRGVEEVGDLSVDHGPDQRQPRHPQPASDPDPRRRSGRHLHAGGHQARASLAAHPRDLPADRSHGAGAPDGAPCRATGRAWWTGSPAPASDS
jgi:regulator of sigma E protease